MSTGQQLKDVGSGNPHRGRGQSGSELSRNLTEMEAEQDAVESVHVRIICPR